MEDWVAWHRLYDDPDSALRTRLAYVTAHLRGTLDQAPPGPIRLLSLCAGQGRDVLEVLVRQADASVIANFADALPVDVLLLAGIFGNVNDADIKRTVDAAPALCAPGATVIWTRHRRPPDVTGQIRDWFAANGFDEVAFEALQTESLIGVGVHRLARRSPEAAGYREQPLFTFGSQHC